MGPHTLSPPPTYSLSTTNSVSLILSLHKQLLLFSLSILHLKVTCVILLYVHSSFSFSFTVDLALLLPHFNSYNTHLTLLTNIIPITFTFTGSFGIEGKFGLFLWIVQVCIMEWMFMGKNEWWVFQSYDLFVVGSNKKAIFFDVLIITIRLVDW